MSESESNFKSNFLICICKKLVMNKVSAAVVKSIFILEDKLNATQCAINLMLHFKQPLNYM